MKKVVTIYDIAREAGVSPATVSRILTGASTVRPEKRERVLELMRQYNYQPNALARALTATRSRLIGMIVADSGNPYYTSVYSACENEAFSRGYSMLLMSTGSRPENETVMLRKTQEMRTDAVILCGGRIDLEVPDPLFMQELAALTEKTRLVVGSRSPMAGIPGIAVDHRASVRTAIQYLAELGHRDIGFIYCGEQYYGTVERLDQFRKELRAYGFPCREEWLIQTDTYSIAAGEEGTRKMLKLERLPTALLGMNDLVSAGILQELLRNGLRVPEDISLLGFDDTFVSEITSPRMSSVSYDYQLFAKMLVDAALNQEEANTESRTIPVFMTERASCAPPQRKNS